MLLALTVSHSLNDTTFVIERIVDSESQQHNGGAVYLSPCHAE